MASDNFQVGRAAGRTRATESIGVVGCASWRLASKPIRLAILDEHGSMIYPPLSGELPGYVISDISEEWERDAFATWVKTLTPADQALVEKALQMNAEGVPLDTISRRLRKS